MTGAEEIGRADIFPLQTSLDATDHEACDRLYREDLIADQFCAKNALGKGDNCQGDSGGPLTGIERIEGRSRVAVKGVSSAAQACGQNGVPSVFSNVYGERERK